MSSSGTRGEGVGPEVPHVVGSIDEAVEDSAARRLPSLADFRASLGATPLPGSAVLEARETERS